MNQKTIYYFFILLFFYISGCKEKNNLPISHKCYCKLSSVNFHRPNRKDNLINLYYNDKNNLSLLTAKFEKTNYIKKYHYHYDSLDNIISIKSKFKQFLDKAHFHYNNKKQLIKITGNGNFITKEFKYNFMGNIHKELLYFNKKLYQYTIYHYNNNTPIKSKVYDSEEKHIKTHLFRYDKMKNPFYNIGQLYNTTELIYGYAVGNAPHNLSRVITVFQTDSTHIVEGKLINKGYRDTIHYQYTYNLFGYPTTINDNVFLQYFCQKK